MARNKLLPTHIKFQSGGDKGKSYAPLEDGTTWKQAKESARNFDDPNAKPVRRK